VQLINIEVKARCGNAAAAREVLQAHNAEYKGLDHQTDTYFNTGQGRLKLREGHIENNLIFYNRTNQAGPKSSHFILTEVKDAASLKASLAAAYGVKVVVEKQREIWYVNNVKLHIDTVIGLGHFVEIEAGNRFKPEATEKELQAQCDYFMSVLNIGHDDLMSHSYSDMLLELSA
jgi:predicted adenylyl cyclase CyaB